MADLSKSKALLVFTSSGGTVFRMAKLRPNVPIIAACYNIEIARQLALVWGVYPVVIPRPQKFDLKEEVTKLCKAACDKGFADPTKDLFTVTAGLPFGTVGTSNYLRVVAAGGPDYWFDQSNPSKMTKYDENAAKF